MSLVAAERIKLFSTRSPWWCSALAVALVVGAIGLVAAVAPADMGPLPAQMIVQFVQFGMVVVMVMAAVSVTTEYRFATIRTTFQAVPNRTAALLAKTGVVVLVVTGVGLLAGLGSWAALLLLRPDPALALTTDAQIRAVFGPALVFGVAAVLAVAVGILLRQTAGAVALLLVWALLLENIVAVIPNVGEQIHQWLPFANASNFLGGGLVEMPLSPWGSLAYMAALAAALLGVGIVVANRRDA
ncbi:hypothetical protein [Pseudonocardia sp. GCM10023141]|uniref:hypothetical protein n=1 Tax=Pseudonocardia sp. GCM10023141 TaxID=3252653 RepID=UPI00362106CB